MQKFTHLNLKKLEPGTYYDPHTPGFGIRIGKNRKTWIALKGPRNKRTQMILGHYPSLSLQDARRKALITLGTPFTPDVVPFFREALAEFLSQEKWRPRSKRVLESSLRHFTWTRQLTKITHEDVYQALQAVQSPSARAHALKDIRSFFNWCVPRYLPQSPAQGLKMAPQKARSRVLTHDELRRVWIVAEQFGDFGRIIRLCIVSGQRRGELSELQPHFFDKKRGTLTFPAHLTKNNREHSIPCAPLLIELLGTSMPSVRAWSKPKAELDRLSGVSGWVIHDLRRTFATGLAALNVPIHVTEKILNHVSGTTGGLVGVYQRHSYWPEQVAALKAWEEKLQSLVRPV